MQIIPLNHDSAYLLENIAEDVFDHAINPSSLNAFLDCPRHVMMLAVVEGQVVGMASAVQYFHPDKPPQLWINEIGVTPSQRNRGIGRQLIQSLIDKAKEMACQVAWLGTDEDNFAAQHCFNAIDNGQTTQKFLLYEWPL